jgi:hypothetical protein
MMTDDELVAQILEKKGFCMIANNCDNCKYHTIEIKQRNRKKHGICKITNDYWNNLLSANRTNLTVEMHSDEILFKWANDYLEAKQAKEKTDYLETLK